MGRAVAAHAARRISGASVLRRKTTSTWSPPRGIVEHPSAHLHRDNIAALLRDATPCNFELDHIFPRSRGGDNSPLNIVTACLDCNNRKGNRTPEEARMPLLTTQSALRVRLERVVLCHYAEARPEWRKYLFLDAEAGTATTQKEKYTAFI